MLPGPTIVRQCPACGVQVRESTIASGNSSGARYWTDGFIEAPMLPHQSALAKCDSCGQVSWLKNFAKIDQYESYLGYLAFSEDEGDKKRLNTETLKKHQYENLQWIGQPDIRDLSRCLTECVLSAEEELYARVRFWQMGNDPRRGPSNQQPLAPEEIINLQQIADLLEMKNDYRLLLAEIYRQLGNTEKSIHILESQEFSKKENRLAEFVLRLARAGDTRLQAISKLI